MGQVPLNSRIKRENVPKEVYECYMALMKEKEIRLTGSSSLDLVLVVFLLNIGEFVNDKIFEQYLLFSKAARGAFCDHGEEVYRYFFVQRSPPFPLKGFAAGEVAFFPVVADFLVSLYVPKVYPVMGDGREVNLSTIELHTFEFCSWLHKQKMTQIRIELEEDFALDYQPSLKKPTPVRLEEPKEEELSEEQSLPQHPPDDDDDGEKAHPAEA